MDTKFGLRGTIVPTGPFKTANEAFVYDGFEVEIADGAITIGYNNASQAEHARKIVDEHLAWHSLSHRSRYTADLNVSWETKQDNKKAYAIGLFDSVKVTTDIRVTTSIIEGEARVVTEAFDSSKIATSSALVQKSQKSPALAAALAHFSQEVIDDDRPLYGVYKALEELCHAVGGRVQLAALVNKQEKYVGDVMETTQTTRHAKTRARSLLSDDECRDRAYQLILAFADTI